MDENVKIMDLLMEIARLLGVPEIERPTNPSMYDIVKIHAGSSVKNSGEAGQSAASTEDPSVAESSQMALVLRGPKNGTDGENGTETTGTDKAIGMEDIEKTREWRRL